MTGTMPIYRGGRRVRNVKCPLCGGAPSPAPAYLPLHPQAKAKPRHNVQLYCCSAGAVGYGVSGEQNARSE